MIDQPGENAGLIADFMQVALAFADRLGRDLPNDRQHRRIHAVGREQSCSGIEQAGTGHNAIGLRLAGRERRAQRHIGGALFVAGVDHAKCITRALEGVE